MQDWDDREYVAAFREAGEGAVNRLLQSKFPNPADRIHELERLEDTGDWEILWHSAHPSDAAPDQGSVRTYRG